MKTLVQLLRLFLELILFHWILCIYIYLKCATEDEIYQCEIRRSLWSLTGSPASLPCSHSNVILTSRPGLASFYNLGRTV
jgi:hypothetical protein